MTPYPFIKSAGGKGKMVATIVPLLSACTGRFHEPCVGGGAMFWALRTANSIRGAHLGDANAALVNAYVAVRDHLPQLLERLAEHAAKHRAAQQATFAGLPAKQHYYYAVRDAFNGGTMTPVDAGAAFIYLNKTCFNGLWRVNAAGHFNVPLGSYANPLICDEPNLGACSTALQGVEIRHEDFAAVLDRANEGDLVYFDPPYAPTSATSRFANYTADGFGTADHARMANVAAKLKLRGVGVVISNSDTPIVRDLYGQGFELLAVQAPRSMAARGASRGKVQELVIR